MTEAVVVDLGISFTGNPCRVVTGQFNGRYLKGGERLWAALIDFQEWLDLEHPGFYIYVIQSAYNDSVQASAGTHDYDGSVDIAIINRKTGKRVWLRAQRWCRIRGFAAWWRHTGSWAALSSYHIHMNLLGTVEAGCPVGEFIPAQNDDYKNHRTGLVGHLLAPGWYPKNIKATIFDYSAWLKKKQEEMMEYKDWSQESKDEFVEDVRNALMDAPFNKKQAPANSAQVGYNKVTVRSYLKDAYDNLKGK